MKKGESHIRQVHVVHMDPVVAAAIKSKPVASLKMAMVLPPESRLYLVESDGGLLTGRADLCTVVGRDGDRLVFERRMCWHQQAPNPLVEQHLEVLPIIYVRLTEANL